MTGGVGVLGSEGRSKSVDIADCARVVFDGQLAGHCKEGWLAEEVLFVVDFALLKGDDFLGRLLWLVVGCGFSLLFLLLFLLLLAYLFFFDLLFLVLLTLVLVHLNL